MTMKVVFLVDSIDHKAGWDGFISRQLGRRLCQQEIAIPWSIRHHHAGYQEMLKARKDKEEKERAKAKADKEAEKERVETEKQAEALKERKEKTEEIVSAKKKRGRKKAVSVSVEARETAIAE